MQRKWMPQQLIEEDAREVVDIALLIAALQGRHNAVLRHSARSPHR